MFGLCDKTKAGGGKLCGKDEEKENETALQKQECQQSEVLRGKTGFHGVGDRWW